MGLRGCHKEVRTVSLLQVTWAAIDRIAEQEARCNRSLMVQRLIDEALLARTGSEVDEEC